MPPHTFDLCFFFYINSSLYFTLEIYFSPFPFDYFLNFNAKLI